MHCATLWLQGRHAPCLPALLVALLSACPTGGSGQPDTGTPAADPADAGDSGGADAGASGLVADPGPDRTVTSGVRVTLDGTRSRSDQGPVTTWSWRQVAGPTVSLSEAGSARPGFDAPTADGAGTTLRFELTVRDAAGRSATSIHSVAVWPGSNLEETTSAGKVRRAMAEGRLDRETAVQYLAFAVHEDPRLPAEYRGLPGRSGTWAMRRVREEYPLLGEAARQVVAPFLMPAHAEGSWYDRLMQGSGNGGGAAPQKRSVDGKYVRVWYFTNLPNGPALAEGVRAAVDTVIWPKLKDLMGRGPLEDTGQPDNGGDGRLDITLVSVGDPGTEVPYLAETPTPARINLNGTYPLSSKSPPGLVQSAAHELMHAVQDAFKQTERYSQAMWLFESTATWAEHFVYPEVDTEHGYAKDYLDTLHLPLEVDVANRIYGEYLLFQYLTEWVDHPELVRRVWEQFQTKPALTVLDDAFADGTHLADHWEGFLQTAWNRGDQAWFKMQDRLTVGARAEGGAPVSVPAAGTLELPAAVAHTTGRFHHLVFDGPGASAVIAYDGLRSRLEHGTAEPYDYDWLAASLLPEEEREGVVAMLLPKIGGVWRGNHTLSPQREYCRDLPSERLEELVVVFGDGLPRKNHSARPAAEPPTLVVSDLACGDWAGTSKATTVFGGVTETLTAKVVWGRTSPAGLGGHQVKRGSFDYTISGDDEGFPERCVWSGSDRWSFDEQADSEDDRPSGALTFLYDALTGPGYRAYFGMAGSDHGIEVTKVCTSADGTQTYTEWRSPTWWQSTSDLSDEPPTAGAGGRTAAGSSVSGMTSYDWSFEAP